MSMDWVEEEFGQVDLGDRRLNARVLSVARTIAPRPSAGFTQLFTDPSQLEGLYRLVNNDRVSADALLEPHHDATWRRAREAGGETTLVVHDSSEFVYAGEVPRERLKKKAEGSSFYGHIALAVEETELPVVHGVVGQSVYRVDKQVWVEGQHEDNETELLVGSDRWGDLAESVRKSAPKGHALVHVMDREADDYALMTRILAQGDDFVIRASHNRVLFGLDARLFDATNDKSYVVQREVTLSRRGKRRLPADRKTHPDRDAREARVSIRATVVSVVRPRGVGPFGEPTMQLSYVEVVELDPPEGEEPVHWRLLTTLPTSTAKQLERVVDIYRKRWLIEEFFKALKTGCSAEKRQGRSLSSLWNTVALLVPIAWRTLHLRVTARAAERRPASAVIDDVELLALRELVPKRMLSARPTALDVVLAIARLGGHLKSNGEPGWLTLGRGMETLYIAATAWRAAIRMMDERRVSEL